jgi:phenylalanine-4-hydroxylase
MNERIKEFEKQATTVVEGWSDENGTTRYYEFNKEKFAELIVRECMDLVKGFTVEDEVGCLDYIEFLEYEASEVLKKHFGVEE